MHKKSLKALFSCFKALSFIYVFQAVHCVCCLTKICPAVSVVAFFVYVFFFCLFFSSRFAIIYLNVSRAAIMARNTEEAMMIDLAYSSCHLD